MHLMIDAVVGVVMIFAPYWIGFREDSRAVSFFVAYGVAANLIVLFTEPESSPS